MLYEDVMGRSEPPREAPAAEQAASARQYAAGLITRLSLSVFGEQRVELSSAITSAMRYTGCKDRGAMRRQLRGFMDRTTSGYRVVLAVWLQLCADNPTTPAYTLQMAEAYSLDPLTVGRAILSRLDRDRVETICHIASVTGQDAFKLACHAIQIEANAGIPLDRIATGGLLDCGEEHRTALRGR